MDETKHRLSMGRLSTSWTLLKASWDVLKQDKELLWMPVLSFLASVVAFMGVMGIGIGAGVSFGGGANEQTVETMMMVLGAAFYLVMAFIATYFHAATVGAAWQRLEGGDPTVGSALREANKHLGKLFLWSVILATVNIILRAIRRQGGTVAHLAAGIAGGAWNLATYFVVPNLMFTQDGVGGSLKSSVGIFRRRWGETLVGHAGIGFAMGLLIVGWVLLGLAITFGLSMVLGVPGAITGGIILGIGVLILVLVGSVLAAVYKTALYRYATQGSSGGASVGGFDDQTLSQVAY